MSEWRFSVALVLIVFLAFGAGLCAQPVITRQPASALNQPLGSNVTLCASAKTSSTNALAYQWLKNGVLISPDGNTYLGVNSECLTINDLQAIDGGAFTVLVSDGVGVVLSRLAEVTVVGAGITIVDASSSVSNAITLPSQTQFVVRSSNSNFVKQVGTPNIIPNDPGGSEIWFQWTMPSLPAGGIMTFGTLGSDFDTTLGVYTILEASGKLTPVPSAINDDDGAGYLDSLVSFNPVTGTTYFIGVDGFYGAQGDLVLNGTFSEGVGPLPVNVGTPLDIVVSNNATLVLASPWTKTACDWFFNGQQIASSLRSLTISNFSADNAGAYMASLTVSSGSFTIHSEPILVQLNLLRDGSTATNSVIWNKFLNSFNDSFAQGAAGEVVKLGDTGGYTDNQTYSISRGCVSEPGQPLLCAGNSCCANWYTYVTPSSGTLEISTVNATTDFPTIVGVFYATPVNGFGFPSTMAGCGAAQNGVQPSIYISQVPSGQSFCVMVQPESNAGTGCASGTYNLGLYFDSCNLNIVKSENTIDITWPVACGTNLQSSASPKGPWKPVTAAIATVPLYGGGNEYSCGLPVAPGNVFFSLR